MVLKKSQRAVSFLLSLIMVLALSSVFCISHASAIADGEWQYEIENGGATITSYIGTNKSITVPAKVGDQKVIKVSGLCTNNFKTSVTAVTFSNGISVIGDSLLKGYVSLERVSLPETLTTIGNDAFLGCTSLTGITLPNSVTTIGTGAFSGCTSLVSASLACKATSIPDKLFYGDTKLNTLSLPTYAASIGESAFESCSSLKNVVLPDAVKAISNSAFSKCSGLTYVYMPSELKTIGDLSFYNCTSLASIFIPNKTKTIGNEAFSGCESLKTIYISPSVTVLKNDVLKGCDKLESIVFGGDYFNFNLLSVSVDSSTIYYPSKCASTWADYTSSKMKSYQAPVTISISGKTNVAPGSKINLTVSMNGDFSDAYVLSSSNPTVATVSADGTVLARATGVTTITATAVTGITKSVDISVTPDSPTNVSAESKTTTSAVISWTGAKNVTGYNIYRSTSKTGTFKKVGTTTTLSYTDKGLTKGKTYYYKVESYVSSDGKQISSVQTSAVSVTATAPAPGSITVKKAKSGAAKITWGKSTGASGYEVYMATSKNGKYTKISTISKASTLSTTKTGLKSGKTYYFKVRSYTTVNGKKIYSDYTAVKSAKV